MCYMRIDVAAVIRLLSDMTVKATVAYKTISNFSNCLLYDTHQHVVHFEYFNVNNNLPTYAVI